MVTNQFQIGQSVQFQITETGIYQVTVVAPEQSGHKVVVVGADYVLCEDENAGLKTRIPFHMIRSVVQPEVAESPIQEPQPLAA